MVDIIGFVASDAPSSNEHRSFLLDAFVYDASKVGLLQFPVACFLENTKRWERVKTPAVGSLVSVTASIAGCTASNHLALRVVDLSYLPKLLSAMLTPTSPTTPSKERLARWEGRADHSTPSKRQRTTEQSNEAAQGPYVDPPQHNPSDAPKGRLSAQHTALHSSLARFSHSTTGYPIAF
jgi:hypothetical protein